MTRDQVTVAAILAAAYFAGLAFAGVLAWFIKTPIGVRLDTYLASLLGIPR